MDKPRRRKNGRLVVSPFYHLFWSVKGHGHGQRSLNVRDRQVAEKLKAEFICEKERVKKTDGRGQQTVKRRAATHSEMESLLSVAGIYGVAYLAAATTGLRRGELSKLEWGDLHLDVAQPFALVRAATTKDRQAAKVELGRQLVAELKKLSSPGMPSNGLVLAGRMPTTKQMREHLAAAGIPYVDEQGRRLDFHALRMTLDTNMGIAGVSDAVRMKVMRHKSPRLTMETYTDSEKLPVAAALAKLPEFACLENGKEHTGKDIGILVKDSPAVSVPVTLKLDKSGDKTPVVIEESHSLSPIGIPGLKEASGGERGIRTSRFCPSLKGNLTETPE
ncbi:MAG: site-specific integrase [Verrucomicrobiia bacterium]